MKLRQIIDNKYKSSRGSSLGIDSRLSTPELIAFVLRRAVQRARSISRLNASGYMGSRVEITARHKLRIGRSVSIGNYVQIDATSVQGIELGDQVTIDSSATLRASGVVRWLGTGIKIGARTSIGAFNMIQGQGGVRIGNDCLLGPSVTVLSENHVFEDVDKKIREQGEIRQETQIGDDVWIGAGAVILAGTSIGNGCVVAAGAVVKGNVAPYSVVGGIPARFLKDR